MEDGKRQKQHKTGRFLEPTAAHVHRCRRISRWILIVVLLAWDGLLLYMIAGGQIEPVYGAGFTAVVSVYLGYQL